MALLSPHGLCDFSLFDDKRHNIRHFFFRNFSRFSQNRISTTTVPRPQYYKRAQQYNALTDGFKGPIHITPRTMSFSENKFTLSVRR